MDKKCLILHIEDEVEVVQLATDILAHPQVAVIGAYDSPSALATAVERQPDMILLDIMMPDMDGYEVFEQLRATPETADIPVVMVTAKSRPHEVIRAQSIEGLNGYVCKPFSVRELRQVVENILHITY